MKKITTISLFFSLIYFTAHAQKVELGLRLGLQRSSYNIKHNLTDQLPLYEIQTGNFNKTDEPRFLGGFYVRYNLLPTRFSIQMDAFRQNIVNLAYFIAHPRGTFGTAYHRKEINIPLTIHFKIDENFRIFGGIGSSINYNTENLNTNVYPNDPVLSNLYIDLQNTFKKTYLFYTLGMGYDFKHFSIDAHYNKSLNSLQNDINAANVSGSFDNFVQNLALSVSYRFFKKS